MYYPYRRRTHNKKPSARKGAEGSFGDCRRSINFLWQLSWRMAPVVTADIPSTIRPVARAVNTTFGGNYLGDHNL